MPLDLKENVEALIGPPANTVIREKERIDYEKTKAPNFSSDHQPGKKKKSKKK